MNLIPIIHFPSHIVIFASFFGKIGQKRQAISFLPHFPTIGISDAETTDKMVVLTMKPMIFAVGWFRNMKTGILVPLSLLADDDKGGNPDYQSLENI